MYQKVNTDLNFVDREKEVEKFWKDEDIFRKSMESRKGGPTYTFYDGPPTANGKPHIGHVLTRVIKDMIPRYRTMKGYYVPRKAGWDTHGLPVELEVEKKLGLDGKDQIEDYGLEPFIHECKESVWKYKGMWEQFSGQVGFWADMDDPYVTYHDDFIESEWWALKQIYDKGLLYKGFKIVPYCPRCGTPLSSHEVAQGYKQVKERSAIARFKVVGEDNKYILAWTTTPWTLPSNVALCVNPEEEYSEIRTNDGYTYIMAKALAEKVLGGEDAPTAPYEIIKTCKGSELCGIEYEPLFSCAAEVAAKQHKKAHFVVADNYVTMEDGTGVVHIAPAFGEDDARVGRENDLPLVQLVDDKGNMTEETPYAGKFVKDADPEIIKDLDIRGLLFSAPKFEHDYPFCWRCDTPLIYYARESWFIKVTDVKDQMIENNKKINWIPQNIGTGRFGEWLNNIQDWAVSRNRYWGTPLNIWECPDCGERLSVGSREELFKLTGLEEAKTFIDKFEIKCEKCGGMMKRVPEVIDCWFDSGAMPFAQHHYPFENKDLFEQQYPAAFISEAVDQTRGWFYSLHAESTLLFGKPAYENVIVLGLVLDEDGNKMSKSKGNAVDPFDALDKFGADAVRMTLAALSVQGRDILLSSTRIETYRFFMNKLWNAARFALMNLDDEEHEIDLTQLSLQDKFILTRTEEIAAKTLEDINNFDIGTAARGLYDFVWGDLCDWYLEMAKPALKGDEGELRRNTCAGVLEHVFQTTLKILHPFIPFVTEELWAAFGYGDEFIMRTSWPEMKREYIFDEALNSMRVLQDTVRAFRNLRAEARIAPQQLLNKAIIKIADNNPAAEILRKSIDQIQNLCKVREIIIESANNNYGASLSAVVNDFEIKLPVGDILDVEKEIARLKQDLAAIEKTVATSKARLSKKDFVDRAPAEVVEKERARVTEGEAQILRLNANITGLSI